MSEAALCPDKWTDHIDYSAALNVKNASSAGLWIQNAAYLLSLFN